MSSRALERGAAPPARWAARCLGSVVALALPVACQDLVAGDRSSVAQELCAELQACYGADAYPCDTLEGALREAAPSVAQEFLDAFEESTCLGSCPGSRACLDRPPYCAVVGEQGAAACATRYDCCGWSEGEASCDAAGGCCRPDGLRCVSDADCCDSSCQREFCGGFRCIRVDDSASEFPCKSNNDCCSRRCDTASGECLAKTCSLLDEPCLSDEDCCESPVDVSGAARVTCSEAGVCKRENQQCSGAAEPCGQSADCCDPSAPVCAPVLEGLQSICCEPDKFSLGIDCAADQQCCGDLLCEPVGGGKQCTPPEAPCKKGGAACLDGECCPGRTCADGKCRLDDAGCNVGPCHSPCEIGVALTGDGCFDPDATCIQAVVAADPFCGCEGWDAICVQRAISTCGLVCS